MRFQGKLVAIYVGPEKGRPLRKQADARLVPGLGIAGDRYGDDGSHNTRPTGTQITLIEREAVEAAVRDCGVVLTAEEARRNLLTEGVPLNHLVGHEFQVGETRLRGVRLCEPCEHLEKLTRPGIREALLHRGGLRADVVTGGTIRPGDLIRPDA